MLHGVVASNEFVLGEVADIIALSGSVAEGKTSQIDVTVGVSSNEVEEFATASALALAHETCFIATSPGMADDKFHAERGNFKDAVHE